jgi:hypothetical protein
MLAAFVLQAHIALVSELKLDASYTVSAEYYAEGETLPHEAMVLRLSQWEVVRQYYRICRDSVDDLPVTLPPVLGGVCDAACPPCAPISPEAQSRIDELLDIKEAQALQIRDTRASLKTWRIVSVSVGLALFLTAGYIASR